MIAAVRNGAAAMAVAVLACSGAARASDLAGAAHRFLGNGLEIVVIPDHRAPVVTHVVAYRFGASDDPPGASGLAHFVEHLMYKGTTTAPTGSFARTVSLFGGRENAVTSRDTTIYHQRAPRDALGKVMAIEADRMVNLVFSDAEVLREREVIIEERRQRIDLSPINVLNERIAAVLHGDHPYRNPVLGWPDEMSRLTREQAEAFYREHYDPANAIVVIQGDVDPARVLADAEETYGRLSSRRHAPSGGVRRKASAAAKAGPIELADPRVTSPALYRATFAPRDRGEAKQAETLEILSRILGQGETSRLHARLVVRDRLASVSEGGSERSRDGVGLAVYAVAAPGAGLPAIRQAAEEEIAKLAQDGVTGDELERAKRVSLAADIFSGDNQLKSALRVAEELARGGTLDEIEKRKARLAAVTAEDVRKAAAMYLGSDRAVVGYLLPMPNSGRAPAGAAP